MRLSRDGDILASCSHDQSIKFWNVSHLRHYKWILEVKRGALPWTTRQTTSLLIFSAFPQSTLDSRRYHKEKKEPRRNREGEDMNLIEDDFNYLTENLKGALVRHTVVFVYMWELAYYILFRARRNKGNPVELQQIIKHTSGTQLTVK